MDKHFRRNPALLDDGATGRQVTIQDCQTALAGQRLLQRVNNIRTLELGLGHLVA
jgi:hypothetical protein